MKPAALLLLACLRLEAADPPVALPTPAPTPEPAAAKTGGSLAGAAAKIRLNRNVDLNVKPAPTAAAGQPAGSPGMPGYSADVVAQVEADCSRQWGTDLAKGRECVGSQILAAAKIKTEPPPGVPDDENRKILAECFKESGRDWVRLRSCQEQRAEAWRSARR